MEALSIPNHTSAASNQGVFAPVTVPASGQIALGGPEDTGQGRLLPTTSVDQFAATLGRWFGVSDSELPLVAPNIANFSTRNLGFV